MTTQIKMPQPIDRVPDIKDASLVGAWLNKGVVKGNDFSVYGNEGTPTDVLFGKTGGYFNGTSSYLDIGTHAELNITSTITYSLWVKSDVSNPLEYLISHYIDATHSFGLIFDTGTYGYVLQVENPEHGDQKHYDVTSKVPNGWTYVVVTYDLASNTILMYVNGISVGVTAGAPLLAEPAGGGVQVARRGGHNDRYFGGQIKDVRINNEVKDQAWVTYKFQKGVPDASLIFDMKDGTEDLSRYKKTLTLNGNAIVGKDNKFDGSGSIGISPAISFAVGDAWTIAFWTQRTGAGTDGMLIGEQSSSWDFIWLYTGNYFRFRNASGANGDFPALTDFSELACYVLTGNNGTLILYKNGDLVDTLTVGTNFEINNIGDVYTGAFKYIGILPELAIYTEAKSIAWAKDYTNRIKRFY